MHNKKILVLSFVCLFCLKSLLLYGQNITVRISSDAKQISNTLINKKTISDHLDIPVGLNTRIPSKFSPTALALVPAIIESGSPYAVNTSYGIPSLSASFTVSGANLSTGITVTPPSGFEVSTDNVNFSSSVTIGGAGTTGPSTIYIRLAAITNAGTYSGNIVLSSTGAANINVNMPNSIVSPAIINVTGTVGKTYGDVLTNTTFYYNTPGFTYDLAGFRNGNTFYSITFSFGSGASATSPVGTYTGSVTLSDLEGQNGFLPANYTINYFPVDLVVQPAPIMITANDVSKPYGTTLTNVLASTNFTVSGLVNNETVGDVSISYSAGAPAPAAPGLYTGSVIPSNAAGGTFSPDNYTITYQPGNLTVDAPPPVIEYTGIPSMLQTIYGTPSTATNVQVFGVNISAAIIVTPPSGFEISIDNINFSNTATLKPDAVGKVVATTIYIRLAAITPVGNYTGNLTLSSTGSGNINIPLVGKVIPAPLTVTALPLNKIYGAVLTGSAGSSGFTTAGLQNGETVGSVTLTYNYGAASGDPVGTYNSSIVPSAATGGSFNAGNYNINYVPAAITVNQATLLITANNISRAFATPNPTFTATYTGFVNNEGPAQLTTLPVISTDAVLTSPIGQYPIIVYGAASPNYIINYLPGTLTIYTDPQHIKVPNAFTPNGDGVNDLWNIKDLQYYPNCTVEIYDRYGQHLYHSHGYGQAWDGRYNNQPLPFGTYYYIINLNDGTSIRLAGYVVIIK